MPSIGKHKWTIAVLVAVIGVVAVVAAAAGLTQSGDVESPAIGPRTPIPGAAKAGLFADDVQKLPLVATSNWKTYSNAKYGYSFKYPPGWELQEGDNQGHVSPYTGEPAYPLQAVNVKNPGEEQGQNQQGVNCQGTSCMGPPPKALGFYVSIDRGHCGIPGDLIVRDTFTVSGRQGDRCVVQGTNQKELRFVFIGFPLGDGTNFIVIAFERGRAVTTAEQAILETILSTFKFSGGSGQ